LLTESAGAWATAVEATPPRGCVHEPGPLSDLGLVRLGGQLQHRWLLLRQLKPPAGIPDRRPGR
jgi:hypothetical protein